MSRYTVSDIRVHEELDKKVNDKLKANFVKTVLQPDSETHLPALLSFIVEYSNGELNSEYQDFTQANELIRTNATLEERLVEAWNSKTYSGVYELEILKAPGQSTDTNMEVDVLDAHRKLQNSFEAEYRGTAADGFFEYLKYNDELFETTKDPQYYAKFCSIVQSSGTGKSRMMTYLATKDVIVIYMNLQEQHDHLSFPLWDQVPATILRLATSSLDQRNYRSLCRLFFIALFGSLYDILSDNPTEETIMSWAHAMVNFSDGPQNTTRNEFFQTLDAKFAEIYRAVLQADQQLDVQLILYEHYKDLTALLDHTIIKPAHCPKLVIMFDEARPLTEWREDSYRPADELCRIISEYSHCEHHEVWVVFASTASGIADFLPPNELYNSDRVARLGELLFQPYVQLGWDQYAPKGYLSDEGLKNVAKMDHIICYGRPLWHSLKSLVQNPREMLTTASYKLCGSGVFEPKEMAHVLAVLGQRFALDITFKHPESVRYLDAGIASHLRIILGTSDDRNWQYTAYPSEPLLSCAAAMALHAKPQDLKTSFNTLIEKVNSGMINLGERGELASRLLWLLGKDFYVRHMQLRGGATGIPSTWEGHLADCDMVPVVDWLQFMFGPKVWTHEEEEINEQLELARASFQDSFINFSHWIKMDAKVGGGSTDKTNHLSLDKWTQCHWQRTSAIQCCFHQPLIDKVIPIYFKNSGATFPEVQMSQILISDKAGRSAPSKDELSNITRRQSSIGGAEATGNLPYIVILADLGQPAKFEASYPVRGASDPCLRIYAAGIDAFTYPFLKDSPVLASMLRSLLQMQEVPTPSWPLGESLSAQVQFGRTAAKEYMGPGAIGV